MAAKTPTPERASSVDEKASERRKSFDMVVVLLGTRACGGRPGGAIRIARGGFADHREELPDHGVLRQPGVDGFGWGRFAEAVGEKDQGRGGAHASQIDEDIAALPPLKPVINDDDVG